MRDTIKSKIIQHAQRSFLGAKTLRLAQIIRSSGWRAGMEKVFLFLCSRGVFPDSVRRKALSFFSRGNPAGTGPVPPEFIAFMDTVCREPNYLAMPQYAEVMTDEFYEVLRRLIRQNRLETLRFVYDHQTYGYLNPDVTAAVPVIFRHYVEFGWKERRTASRHCRTEAYLDYMERHGIPVTCNPLFHFIRQGADFDLLDRIVREEHESDVRRRKYYSKYLDPDFYWADSPDVRALYLDPLLHYQGFGYKEFRDPGASFSTSEYLLYQRLHGRPVKGTPLDDFARQNGDEKLLAKVHDCFTEEFRKFRKKLGVTYLRLAEQDLPSARRGAVPGRIAVHLHLFYEDLLPEMLKYLEHIPQPFDLFVSVPEGGSLRIPELNKTFHRALAQLRILETVRTPNVGRDWAPLIVSFGKKLAGYDYVCHIHTKKSVHGRNATARWRGNILDQLLGSPDEIEKILHLLADGTAKVIYPAPHCNIHNDCSGWDSNFAVTEQLTRRYWNMDLKEFPVVEFSKGSMFWARASAVKRLLDLPLSFSDFPEEPIPPDGTMAHALERLLLIAALEEKGQCICLRYPEDGLDEDGLRKKPVGIKPFWRRLPASDFPYSLHLASGPWLRNFQADHVIPHCPDTDIVVPVFNGPGHLKRLLRSLKKNTETRHRIILADDASTDPEVPSLLEDFRRERPGTLLLHNDRNLGFLPTVNRAAAHCAHDFVLLNMDTEVPEGWLDRLMAHLHASDDIASVTPVSNAATVLSFPEKDTNNRHWAALFGTEETDAVFRSMGLPCECDVPVGVGFCLAIRKKVWEEIGPFDAGSFGRGYGEEVDWCLRAARAGYRHVLAENLYVGHFHGGSFSSGEKKALCESHQKIVDRRYPEFMPKLQQFDSVNNGILRLYRLAALMRLLKRRGVRIVLILTHSWGGGAEQFIRRKIGELTDAGKVVCCCRPEGFRHIRAQIFCGGDTVNFDCDSLDFFFSPDSPPVAELVVNSFAAWNLIAGLFNVSTGFLHDFLLEIKTRKRQAGFTVTYYMHDFLPVCPFYNLVSNTSGRYCEPDPDGGKCPACLTRVHPFIGSQPMPGCDIQSWRQYFLDFLSDTADRIVCFSDNTAEILQKVWNRKEIMERIEVCPHKPLTDFSPVTVTDPDRPVVAVVGTLTQIKGYELVLDFARMAEKEKLPVTLVIIGDAPAAQFPKSVKIHGAFQHDELPDLITHYGVNLAWIPSIWPETFSFVRQELCQMNIPTACFDLGAPRDYIRQWDRGAVIPEFSARSAYDTLRDLFDRVYRENRGGK